MTKLSVRGEPMLRLLLLIFLGIIFGSVPCRSGEVAYPMPGQWTGSTNRDDDTGKFKECTAFSVDRGTTLYVSIGRDFSWVLGFSNEGWKIGEGTEVNLHYRFDRGSWFNRRGIGFDNEGFIVLMPTDTKLITTFAKSKKMEIFFTSGNYHFELDNNADLIVSLVGCVKAGLAANNSIPRAETTTKRAGEQGAQSKPVSKSGTGVVIATSGIVLTNNHVIENCTTFNVTQSGDIGRSARLLRTDVQNDLAILKVDTTYPEGDVATFRGGQSVKAGETIAIYGYPLAGILSASGNIVSGNVTSLSGLGDDVRFFQISAPVQPGNSGGPLIDSSGLIVGIVNSRINDLAIANATGSIPQNVNFAIKGSVAMNFLEAHSIPFKTSSTVKERQLVDITDLAKRFSVFITCK